MTESAASEATLERMLALFDVAPLGPDRFAGETDAGGHAGRQVVEGSQILAQAMVAAGKALPGRVVRSAHALFVAVAVPGEPVELGVGTVRAGRSFASAVVTPRPRSRPDRGCKPDWADRSSVPAPMRAETDEGS